MALDCGDLEDYIGLFECEATELPDVPAVCKNVNGGNGTPPAVIDDENWQTDPVSGKLEKIRAVFLNSKTASEVKAAASTMPVGDWLDLVTKITKQVEIAPVQITAIRIELPPRIEYEGDIVEVAVAQQ